MSKYIDADALITDYLNELRGTEDEPRLIPQSVTPTVAAINAYDNVKRVVENMPAADVEPVSRWISIDEKLPENGSDVLAYSDNGVETRIVPANFANGIWYDCVFNDVCLTITHWMNLPVPPKMDGDSEE